MPNTILTPDEAAKGIFDDIVKVVKEFVPDSLKQKEKLNPEQAKLASSICNELSIQMFYGR